MELINIVTSFGTFLAAIATLLTVYQMNKQRIESYKPIPIIIDKYYKVGSIHSLLPEIKAYKTYIDLNEVKAERTIQIEFINAGAGTMVDLRWKCLTDIKQWKKMLEKNSSNIRVIEDENSISIKSDYYAFVSHSINNQSEGRINYLPFESRSNMVKIDLPHYLIDFFKLLYQKDCLNKETGQPIIFPPKTYIDITYKDIGNRKYKNKIELQIRNISYGYTNDGTLTDFDIEISTPNNA